MKKLSRRFKIGLWKTFL